MTYVDPSSDLPWYMRQGGAGTGPGAGGGPSGAPAGGAPQGGGGQAWLQYLSQLFGGQGQDWQGGMIPSLMGKDASQQPYQTAGLGWTGAPTYDQAAALRRHLVQNAFAGGKIKAASDPGPGDVNVVPPDSPLRPDPTQTPPNGRPPAPVVTPPAAPAAPPAGAPPQPAYSPLSGGSANTGLPAASSAGAPPQPAYNPLAGGSANTGLPYGSGPPPQPAYNPLSGGSANTGLPATGGATGQGATANPRFVTDYRPNADPIRGPYGGAGGPSQMGMLNLAGLFNRGQPAAAAAAPRGTVSVTRPAVPGPLAQNPPMPPTKPIDVQQAQLAEMIRRRSLLQGVT